MVSLFLKLPLLAVIAGLAGHASFFRYPEVDSLFRFIYAPAQVAACCGAVALSLVLVLFPGRAPGPLKRVAFPLGLVVLAVVLGLLKRDLDLDLLPTFAADKLSYDLSGKVAIVTGANSGVGLASAAAIAQLGGTVVMACRSLDKCRAASKEVMRTAANGGRAITMQLDLASFTSIDSFAKDFIDGELRLDYLMANAGFASAPHNGATTTAEGFELGLGAMHFGHFRLFKHLQHLMVDTGGLTLPGKNVRVVVTSSAASQFAGSMGDFDASLFEGDGQGDLKGEKLQVTSPAMYVRAKLANVLFARELQRRMANVPGMAGFTACSCHVGAVATSIWKMPYLWLQYPVDLYTRLAMRTLEQGRRTMLKCLLSEDKDVVGRGAYVDGMGFALDDKDMAPPSNNDTLARRLWDVSESVAGVL